MNIKVRVSNSDTYFHTHVLLAITPEIAVYRYSQPQAQQYLRTKVARLSGQHVSEISRTITRNFAKDGLQEDGKEAVLNGDGVSRM